MRNDMDKIIRPSEYIEKVMGIALSSYISEQINNNTSIVTFPAGHTVIRENEKNSCFCIENKYYTLVVCQKNPFL